MNYFTSELSATRFNRPTLQWFTWFYTILKTTKVNIQKKIIVMH